MQKTQGEAPRCVVCGEPKEICHSLKLSKDNEGKWQSNPVCVDCRRKLIRQAKVEGKFIPFYSITSSEEQARKRNEETLRFKPFLAKYGQTRGPEARPHKDAKLKVVAKSGKVMIAG